MSLGPAYIFGTAGLHRIVWNPARQRLLRLALDVGFRAFDTAPLYGNGLAEAALGQALGADRRRVALTTKFGIPVSAYGAARPWTFTAERAARMALDRGYRASFDRRIWSVAQMRADLEGSLKRLKTGHVERFALHEPLDALPQTVWDDLCEAAANLKAQGKIAAFGISGEQPSIAGLAARPGIDFVQTRASLVSGIASVYRGPILTYGLYGQFQREAPAGDFIAYLKGFSVDRTLQGVLLSSTKHLAVSAYAPLFR